MLSVASCNVKSLWFSGVGEDLANLDVGQVLDSTGSQLVADKP